MRSVYIPAIDSVHYFLQSSLKKPIIASKDLFIEELGLFESFLAFWHFFLTCYQYGKFRFPGYCIFPYGSRKTRKAFYRFNRFMYNRRMPLDSKQFLYVQELFEGWNENSSPKMNRKPKHSLKIAIVAHCYYKEIWPEIANLLSGLNFNFDLFVTIVKENEDLEKDILKKFPSGQLYVMENKGRDVFPFLYLLELGFFESYDYICKIHGKTSQKEGHYPIEGILWRRWLFFDLLGAPNAVIHIINIFENNPHIGMIGSGRYRRKKRYSIFTKRNKVYERVADLSRRMGFSIQNSDFDFFNGTMFWVRPTCLDPIRKLHLSQEFEDEKGLTDGAMEHAVERLLAFSVKQTGFSLEEVDFVSEYEKKSR
ncbi:hypothetical protein H0G72_04770 [Liberibacter sp. Z1]|nr:hypothetical protein [Candidatus Liberibacter sp.]